MNRPLPSVWPGMVTLILGLLIALATPAALGQPSAESTVLRTGDVLFIGLPGESSLNQEFQIDRQGRIWITEIGSISLAGLSMEQASKSVRDQLQRYFRDLNGYDFSLLSRRLLLQVLGHVHQPGEYELADGSDIQTAIAAAGGLRNGAQLDRIQIRRGEERLYVNYKAYLNTGEIQKLPALETLDAVFVPISPLTGNVQVEFDSSILLARGDSSDTTESISVFGQVRTPGSFLHRDGDNLIHYLMKAGGVNNFADVASIRVIGNSGPKLVSLTAFLDSGDLGLLPSISPGTTIFVPLLTEDADTTDSTQGVSIFGQVIAPGRYPHASGRTVLDYLLQAGGVNNFAGVENIRIITAGEPILFNLTEYLDTGEAERLPAVSSGATIFVPVKVDKMQSGSRVVYVMGEVFAPGAFEVQDKVRFLDVLANAGGPTRFADTQQLRILRANGEVTPFNLAAYTEGSATAGLPAIAAGDAIFVPEKVNQSQPSWLKTPPTRAIKILGAVKDPGRYQWSDEMSLLDLLGQSGGPTAQADIAKLRVIPGGIDAGQPPFVFNLEDFIDQGEKMAQPALKSGYTIIMPELPISPIDNKSLWLRQAGESSIYLMGAVGVPGRYAFNEQMNLLDLLAAANGPDERADLHHIKIRDRRTGTYQEFSLSAYLRSDDESLLPVVKPEDVVFVPFQALPSQPVTIIGAVASPGQYEFSEGLTVVQLMALAGGPEEDADLAFVRIKPADAGQAASTFDFVSWQKDAAATAADLPTLSIGDTIVVPRQPDSPIDNKQRWVQLTPDQTIYIIGEVGLPGRYAFNEQMSFLDILAAANGPTPDADLENIRVTLRRPEGAQTVSFDLNAYLDSGSNSGLPDVQTGDVILLTSKNSSLDSLNIIGGVNNPGRIDFTRGMNLIDALALAGGPIGNSDLAHILIVPGRNDPELQSIEFDLETYRKGGIRALPVINPGDSILVPELPEDDEDEKTNWIQLQAKDAIYILGEVGTPGRYAFDNSLSFLDILAAADGPTANADYENIQISHRRNGRIETRSFNLSEYMRQQDDALLPRVRTGDLILVPSENDSSSTVNVIGSVVSPGRVDYRLGMNLIDVLALAGGQSPEGDVAHIIVVPGAESPERSSVEFDLADYQRRGENALPPIGAGDTVIMPALPEDDGDDNKSGWIRVASDNSIYIIGEVGQPGRYAFDNSMHFLDILAAADGPTPDADFENIRVTYRRGGVARTETFNLSQYMLSGDESLLPAVQTGDLIMVPSEQDSSSTINVIGSVVSPGRVDYSQGMNLIDALALAGGQSGSGDTAHIIVVPGEESPNRGIVEFDLEDYQLRGESALPPVGPGDTIIVPELPDEDAVDNKSRWVRLAQRDAIYVLGAVGQPGRYAFNDKMDFLDILSAADGPLAEADYENIKVTYRRADRSWTESFNLLEYMMTGDESLLPQVRNGDMIFMPTEDDSEQTINVIGEVNSPGRIDYSLGMNVVDVIALAGGHTRRADTAHIRVIADEAGERMNCLRGHSCREFDLKNFELMGEAILPRIGPGYTVIVPLLPDDPTDDKARWVKQAKEDSIYVMGAVNQPGRYAFNDKLHFLDIMTAAEGPAPGADLHNIRVSHRNGSTSLVSEVNLALYFETGDEHLLPDVRPQDVIYVPERTRQWLDISKESTVRVLGAVRDPGRYEFNSDMTVLDLLAEAGGTENGADVHSILIITRSVGGNVSHRFDLRDFAGTGDYGDLPVVRAGDTIYVPSTDDSPWQQFMVTIRDILSIVSIIAIVAAL